MSVIVKGMKMPENCWECVETDLNIATSVLGGMCPFCEKIRTDHDMKTGRHPECPLVALPDKHGRLVDADDFTDELENAPTIEPRKKGKWLPDNNSLYEMRFVCSECKTSEIVPTIGFTKYKPIWDFCPNCGARMEDSE